MAIRKHTTTPQDMEPLLREDEAALFLGVSKYWLQRSRWACEGPLYIKFSRAVRYDPRDLRDWVEANRRDPYHDGFV